MARQHKNAENDSRAYAKYGYEIFPSPQSNSKFCRTLFLDVTRATQRRAEVYGSICYALCIVIRREIHSIPASCISYLYCNPIITTYYTFPLSHARLLHKRAHGMQRGFLCRILLSEHVLSRKCIFPHGMLLFRKKFPSET